MPTRRRHTEIANAVTMLPFACFSTSCSWQLSAPATLMWVCATAYHACMAADRHAAALRWFAGDVIGQCAALAAVGALSQCIPARVRAAWSCCSCVALICLTLAAHDTIVRKAPHLTALQAKRGMKATLCAAHVAACAAGAANGCDAAAHTTAAVLLVMIALLFIADEYGLPYAWAGGHLLCAMYTHYTWKAHGLLQQR